MIALLASTTLKYTTPLMDTGTLSLVMACCRGMSIVNTRMSMVTLRSMSGVIKLSPGWSVRWNFPSRKTMAVSYCWISRMPSTKMSNTLIPITMSSKTIFFITLHGLSCVHAN